MSSYNPLKDEIFLPIPLKIAQRKDLKNLSKLVYGYLLKCFGKNGLSCPTMATMAKDLNVSRQMISKCITELKNKGLINIIRTGKANRYEFCDVNSVVTSDVNTVATSDVKNGFTSPYIKEKGKEKIKENAPAGHSFDYFFKKIREFGCYKIKEQTLKKYWDMGYKADLMRLADGLDKYDIDDRVLILQSTLKSFDKKEQMKNERKNIKKNEAYKMDIAILAGNNILSHLFESV